jgi:putative transposase
LILELVEEAVQSGARQSKACEVINISARTLQRWRKQNVGEDRRHGPLTEPRNKFSKEERNQIVDIANSPEYRDLSPGQIVPALADKGVYIASESSFYRVLAEEGQNNHRGPSKPRKRHKPKELKATGPNQVYSWDISYLRSNVRGEFFYLYFFLDVWSRKIVGWTVAEREDSEISAELFKGICKEEKFDPKNLAVHSDNGGPMKGTMMALLDKLEVKISFSRPRVSNDNSYSESLFRTMKYRPWYPKRPFKDIEEARDWVTTFVYWYNRIHLHSSICFVAPHQRHEGMDVEILNKRKKVYEEARRRRPDRWSGKTRNWNWIEIVKLNPDINEKNLIKSTELFFNETEQIDVAA